MKPPSALRRNSLLFGLVVLIVLTTPTPTNLPAPGLLQASTMAGGALRWNTFMGGGGTDVVKQIVATADGGLLLTGNSSATWGNPLHAHAGDSDAFVARIDANGNLKWLTFLGGPSTDYGNAIAVASDGGTLLTGLSFQAWGNPLHAFSEGWYRDAFAAKLDASGNLMWLTFLGGAYDDDGNAIASSPDGGVVVAGTSGATWGRPLRAYSGGFDAFVARFDANGTLRWHTFLGSVSEDKGNTIAIAPNGAIWLAGSSSATWGKPLQPHSGGKDTFIAQLDTDGALKWHTFLTGGANNDGKNSIVMTPNTEAVLTGSSNAAWGTPVRAYSGGSDAFVARLDVNGNLKWHTFLGADHVDFGASATSSPDGDLIVTGKSDVSWGNPLHAYAGDYDAFIAWLDTNGNLKRHTFLGGAGTESGTAIAVAADGRIMLAGESQAAWGNPLRAYHGNIDVFVAQLEGDAPLAGPSTGTARARLYVPITLKDWPQPKECDTPGLDCGEPNEQASQAYGPLELGRNYYASVGGADDAKDWYHLNLQGGSTYEIFLNFDGFNNPGNADLDIVLRRNQPPDYPLVIFSSNQAQRFERFTFKAPATGSYVVLIDSATPNVRTLYTLQVQQAGQDN